MKNPKSIMVILGTPGTGKTYMCAAFLGWAINKFRTFRCWKESELLGHLRDSIDRYGDYSTSLKQAIDDEFMILDDLGSSPVNDWRKEIIFTVIETRYSMAMPTIITSNLTQDQIANKYDERTASRLFASENSIIDMFNMCDLRKEGL
jgi:DNA replication protein DnaC